MQIDITTLLIGIVIGAAIAFLIRMTALRSLNLNLEKIGISLGVEGFPEPKVKPSGVQTGDISGTVGDIAGRDMDKSTRYGPKNTLNQSLSTLIESVDQLISQSNHYEQQSRLFRYQFNGDVPRIHENVSRAIAEGWFVSNITTLNDYEGSQQLWVILTRSIFDNRPGKIHLVDIPD